MSKRFLITVITLIIIAMVAGVAIFFAKGYRFSTDQKRVIGTGIVTVASEPDSASVFVDGHLTTATNATISSLPAKTYTIKVIKEGFIPWEKQIEVKEGLVNEIKITLFPAAPTIYPLTFNGVSNPVLSEDGTKLAYLVPASGGKKAGVWVWTMVNNQPIAFARSAEPHQIVSNSVVDFSKATLSWSADSKQVLATVGANFYLLEADKLNTSPKDVTSTISAIKKSWEEDVKAKEDARKLTIKNATFRKIASDSATVAWSPDETKFMSRKDAKSEMKVYDLEDNQEHVLPAAKAHIWLPDSNHIILVEDGAISLAEFDGTNKAIIYAGKFEDSFVFPWPDSSRLVIISSFPTPTASEPNFYGINLR